MFRSVFKRFTAVVPYMEPSGGFVSGVAVSAAGIWALFSTFSTNESVKALHQDFREFRVEQKRENQSLRDDLRSDFWNLREEVRSLKKWW